MSSFLDNENQMVIDAIYSDIGDYLVEQWIQSNLDESQFYADQQVALLSGDSYIRDKFNKFYGLNPDDQYYLEVE